MIGVQHMNGDNRMMEDRIPFDERESDAPVDSDCNLVDPIPSSKKPSLLKSQLLRRTNTRTRKRSPPGVAKPSLVKEDHIVEMPLKPTDTPVSVSIVGDVDTTTQTSIDKDYGTTFKTSEFETNPNALQSVGDNDGKDNNKDDGNSLMLHQLHHNAEIEIKSGTTIQKDDPCSSLEVSDDESKIEVDSNRQTKEGKPPQPKIATTAATTNLSIVMTGSDVVVEYRDDSRDDKRCDFSERKEASPQSSKQLPIRSRPKGIMKRPRDSNITYHHPRRPLPPPLPPPGYREASSPMSCTTATSTDDSTYSSVDRKFPPLRKRVSFNEKELVEQYQMSKIRRQERYERRRSFLGVLSMAMPVIMPYLMAVLILIASSLVPLPTDQRHAQHSLSLQEELAAWKNKAKAPTPQPIFIDVGSRMWDDRMRSKEAARSAALEAAVTEYINQETNAAFSSRL